MNSTIIPTVLSAQMIPGFDPTIGYWLWAIEDTRCRTKEALIKLDRRVLDWVAPSNGLSISSLLYHIAAIEADWLYAEILGGADFPFEIDELFQMDLRDDKGKLPLIKGESLSSHCHRLDMVRRYLLATFDSMPLDEFRRYRKLHQYHVTPEWVLHHLIQHEAEHRGLIMEIRKMGEEFLQISQ